MTDLLFGIPSRGRPENVRYLLNEAARTCRADTLFYFGFDDDDPRLEENIKAADGALYDIGPRDTLTGWTNTIIMANLDCAPYFGSMGDDHVPVTPGWDEQLITTLERAGPGYAYPNDLRRDDIPEAVVISRPIVRELEWMSPKFVTHWYQDNVWADLGRATGSLHYLPKVIVRLSRTSPAARVTPPTTMRPGSSTRTGTPTAAGGSAPRAWPRMSAWC